MWGGDDLHLLAGQNILQSFLLLFLPTEQRLEQSPLFLLLLRLLLRLQFPGGASKHRWNRSWASSRLSEGSGFLLGECQSGSLDVKPRETVGGGRGDTLLWWWWLVLADHSSHGVRLEDDGVLVEQLLQEGVGDGLGSTAALGNNPRPGNYGGNWGCPSSEAVGLNMKSRILSPELREQLGALGHELRGKAGSDPQSGRSLWRENFLDFISISILEPTWVEMTLLIIERYRIEIINQGLLR